MLRGRSSGAEVVVMEVVVLEVFVLEVGVMEGREVVDVVVAEVVVVGGKAGNRSCGCGSSDGGSCCGEKLLTVTLCLSVKIQKFSCC